MAKKTRMNRGLDDLFSDNTLFDNEEHNDNEESSVKTVRLSLLEPNKDQPRSKFDDETLNELADSIKENGVIQPILVRPLNNGGYQIVAGERRWRASRLAGLTEVPVFIKELDDKKTMQIALIENIQRQDLSPIEEALAYKNLMDTYGMTQDEVAKSVGKSRSAVANFLRLLNISDKLKELVNEGKLSAGHARTLVGLDEEKQIEIANESIENNWSVRQLEEFVSSLPSEKDIKDKEKKAEQKILKENSFKMEKPFLREFEQSINSNNSDLKVKIRADKKGHTNLNITVGNNTDIESFLIALSSLLQGY